MKSTKHAIESKAKLTPAIINQRNNQYWTNKSQRVENASELELQLAYRFVLSEANRLIPLQNQKSFLQAVEDTAEVVNIVRKESARTAGQASKTDELQKIINAAVISQPTITPGQLVQQLRGLPGSGVVTSIDSVQDTLGGESPKIHFMDSKGKEKVASVSGLKDRIARAKKKSALSAN